MLAVFPAGGGDAASRVFLRSTAMPEITLGDPFGRGIADTVRNGASIWVRA
jgi:hypothetical protein